MAGNTTLSVPGIIVNNEPWAIVPNSFKYDGGEGSTTVKSASTGGSNVESVHSENAEDKIGKCSFDIFLKAGTDAKIAVLKANIGANSIEAIQRAPAGGDSQTLSFNNMSLCSPVEREASADGTTSLEFEGDPMSIQ